MPHCNANNNEFTSFPVMPNESFTFDYNDKLGVGEKIIANLLQKLEIVIK
jgi:hypothetical protein